MENLGYYNGRYAPIEQMTVPINDRACFFGDGIYEAAFCRNHIIYALDEHLDRLYHSAELLKIAIPHTKEEMGARLCDLIRKVGSPAQLSYLRISRGTQLRNHAPAKDLVGNVWIMLRPRTIADTYAPMRLITVEDTRYQLCHMKTLNLLPSVLASAAADEAGVDEAVFHRGESVTECAHSNIAILTADGVLKTAPADHQILAGIARAHLLRACEALGIPVDLTPFTVTEMMDAAEVIVVSSSSLCRPVIEIDGKPVGGKAPALLGSLQEYLLNDYLTKTTP